jgi:hypothetical protein
VDAWDFEHPCANLLLQHTIPALPPTERARALQLYGAVVKEKHARDADIKPARFRMGRFDDVFAHLPDFVAARARAISEVRRARWLVVLVTCVGVSECLTHAPMVTFRYIQSPSAVQTRKRGGGGNKRKAGGGDGGEANDGGAAAGAMGGNSPARKASKQQPQQQPQPQQAEDRIELLLGPDASLLQEALGILPLACAPSSSLSSTRAVLGAGEEEDIVLAASPAGVGSADADAVAKEGAGKA